MTSDWRIIVGRRGGDEMYRMLRCALALICFAPATVIATADSAPSPQDLVKVVNESSNFFKLLPYQLTASLVLTPDKDLNIQGNITYYRDRDQERIEITAGEYRETRVHTGDKQYVAGTRTRVLPRRILLETLEKQWLIDYPTSCCLAFGEVERKKMQGASVYCFVVNSQKQRPKRFCVDRDSRSLLETSDGFETVKFLAYRSFRGLQYPSEIKVIDDGKTFLEIHNIEIRQGTVPPESFNVPLNSQEFENCGNLEPSHVVRMEMPNVPSRWHSSYGSVYGLVQPDGSFSDVEVEVSRANPGFAQVLKEAATQWKFSPARCGSRPIAREEQMEIHN
jgi:hypothetical protein